MFLSNVRPAGGFDSVEGTSAHPEKVLAFYSDMRAAMTGVLENPVRNCVVCYCTRIIDNLWLSFADQILSCGGQIARCLASSTR